MDVLRELGFTQAEIAELWEKTFTALDGLWFLGVEKELGFEAALRIDIEVWKGFGLALIRRMKKLGKPSRPSHEEALKMLKALFLLGHLPVEVEEESQSSYLFRVTTCPWWENLKRAGRERLVPCHVVDQEIFKVWLPALDEGLTFQFLASRPQGDTLCQWRIGFGNYPGPSSKSLGQNRR
ncbi:MAG: hypothetical protein HY998_07885 [candidate division NC10 bacterium]|nr:hypothetical protein [candidate division NC10 bacterium]